MAVSSIKNYIDLQNAVADYLTRDDLTTQIQLWIFLLESEFNRAIRNRQMEVRFTTQTTPNQSYLAIPDDYLRMRHVALYDTRGSPRRTLNFKSPTQIDALYRVIQTSRPSVYHIFGQELRLAPTPDTIYTVELFYLQKIPLLRETPNGINWLIQRAPDLYLLGTLIHAQAFLIDPAQLASYKELYQVILSDLAEEEFEEMWESGGGLSPNTDVYAP